MNEELKKEFESKFTLADDEDVFLDEQSAGEVWQWVQEKLIEGKIEEIESLVEYAKIPSEDGYINTYIGCNDLLHRLDELKAEKEGLK